MVKKLPVYELQIDENKEEFVEAIALVENPAIESNFLAFSQDRFKFALDDDKMELLGAAMIPDMKIYRVREDGFEYEVFFSKDTIRKISQVFFKKGLQSNLNIEHNSADKADSFTFQSMIVDKAKGIAPLGLPDGSWVIGVKVNDKAIWNDIKSGKRKGFSVEGVFELIPAQFKNHIQPTVHINNYKSGEEKLEDFLDKVLDIFSNANI